MPEMLRYKRQNKTDNRGNKIKNKIKIPTFNLLSKEDREELLRLFPDEFERAVNWDVIDKMTDKEKDNE